MILVKKVFNFLCRGQRVQSQQVRNQFDGWQMLKDFRKRQSVEAYGKVRVRLNVLRENKVLPIEVQQLAKQECAALPKYSTYIQLRRRCTLTSRPRGTINPYRISRIVFRHLADYNKLAGITRARW